ncbi:type II toxin-antitoxin system HicB family antitoxin [Enterococcus sp. CSURQ0835]|uniref:type II toxin-antitoxin system HicB family antitoxin n=1 Tax=Enterococcus sp. CSURQ0835 TaxID=2681394 RepID=UPI00135C4117|nr:type II toxin-antitoxin system HicB family antitoxin [Enterococcus sp. CSURQ0835]
MLVTYPALFYYDFEAEHIAPYFVHFPDLESSGTQGDDISDAMMMAADYLGGLLSIMIEENEPIPAPPNIHKLSLTEDDSFKDEPEFSSSFDPEKSFISMVTADLTNYLNGNDPVEKTLTVPKWANRLGQTSELDFSKTLVDAIVEKHLAD